MNGWGNSKGAIGTHVREKFEAKKKKKVDRAYHDRDWKRLRLVPLGKSVGS